MLKTAKEEIIYLLTKVIEKYKEETGQEIIQNTNRKNYEVIAITLSEISNQLPITWETFGTEQYPSEVNPKNQEYPYRKYDITGGQIKDALNGVVSSPRAFLVDACYIYIYGKGRKAFLSNPTDNSLLEKLEHKNTSTLQTEILANNEAFSQMRDELNKKNKNLILVFGSLLSILLLVLIGLGFNSVNEKNKWQEVKKDFNILSYHPTKAEIDSLEGVWLCYTGSPQARASDTDRYHKVVSNIVDVKYKNGYFTYNRYGASFDHIGYMQFESPGLVSIYSHIKNNSAKTESPRHSLLNLKSSTNFLSAISASWNFDSGEKNTIIGIREIYIKQGKGGTVEEVLNEVENATCKCKIIRWQQENKEIKNFYLKNQLLDLIPEENIKPLINEHSILLNLPTKGLIISKDSIK